MKHTYYPHTEFSDEEVIPRKTGPKERREREQERSIAQQSVIPAANPVLDALAWVRSRVRSEEKETVEKTKKDFSISKVLRWRRQPQD